MPRKSRKKTVRFLRYVKLLTVALLCLQTFQPCLAKAKKKTRVYPQLPATKTFPKGFETPHYLGLYRLEISYYRKVAPLLRKACFDCHSSETNYPWYYEFILVKKWINEDVEKGKQLLDLSVGFPFKSNRETIDLLKKMKSSLVNKTMPPLEYQVFHWNDMLTQKEMETVLDWLTFGERVMMGQWAEN